MVDVILRGGTVIDDTCRARYRADVAIAGDRIAEIGPGLPTAVRARASFSNRIYLFRRQKPRRSRGPYLRRFCTSTPSRARAAISASEKPWERSTASPCSLKRGGALRVPPGVRESLIGVPRPR